MNKKEKNIIARRLAHAYLSSIISISLVLLLVGIFGLVAINARSVSDYFKENILISAVLREQVTEEEALAFEKTLQQMPFVKQTQYISKEQGTKEMKEMLGADFLDVFETNPIPISIEIRLKAAYFSLDSIRLAERRLAEMAPVEEVVYQASLIGIINRNMERIGLILMIFILLMLFVSFVLINNTVRLNIYSKRFSIYTMRLVGATKRFIRAPFLTRAVFQGLLAGLLAAAGLVGALFFVKNEFARLFSIFDMQVLLLVLGGTVLLGVVICWVCTYFVVGRLVSLRSDDLYY